MTERTALAERTQRFDLRTLYESSQILSASLDLDFILNNLLLTVMSKLFVTRGCVLMRRPSADAYLVQAVKGIPNLSPDSTFQLEGALPTRVETGEKIPEALHSYRIELVAPLSFGDTPIGIVCVGKKATGAGFDANELEFIESLVNMSSAAVHNSMVVDELRRTNRMLDGKIQQLNTLFDISQEFNATVDRDRLVKLLSFALMGQMLVRKHIFLLRSSAEDEDGEHHEDVRVVSAKGVERSELDEPFVSRLCALPGIASTADSNGELDWVREKGLDILIPIRHQGETCALLGLGPKMTGQPYQPDEVEFLTALGNLAFVSIQNSFLVEEQIEKERLEQEMRLARQIQEGLQPSELPVLENMEIAMLALPSRHVAGDYTDVIRLDDHRVLTAIGDVTGKGMPASLLMSNLQAALRILVPMDISLEEATGHINRVICENTGYDRFITYFHGIYDSGNRTFRYVNAGHNPPILVRSDGTVELLETGGLLLGVMRHVPYECGSVEFYPGDVLAMFTDGVTEAMSPDEEEYEEHRLEDVLRRNRHLRAQEILDAVRADVIAFTGSATALSDDLTMLVLKAS